MQGIEFMGPETAQFNEPSSSFKHTTLAIKVIDVMTIAILSHAGLIVCWGQLCDRHIQNADRH